MKSEAASPGTFIKPRQCGSLVDVTVPMANVFIGGLEFVYGSEMER